MERKGILFWVWVTTFVVWSGSFFSTLATTDLPLPVRVRFGVIITFTLATLAAVSYVTHEVWPRGISSDEDLERARQKDIWKAIKKWVGDGAKILSFQTDGETHISYTYPLTAEPPELVVEIKYCLSQNYPSLWNERERFLTRKIEYTKKIFGTKEEMSAAREALHDDYKTLEKHFESEIIEKHYSRLRT